MRHVGTVTKSSKFAGREFVAQCSCGTAGAFALKQEAIDHLQQHFGKLSGIETSELIDATDQPEAKPVLTTHIGGVGTMPETHAAGQQGVVESSEPETEQAAAKRAKKKRKR